MTRCVIHIGMHKTGSTSIQQSLHGFADDRMLYAALGKTGNHSFAMSYLFARRPERHGLPRALEIDGISDYTTRMRADLERAIEAAQGRTLIISGEGISTRLPQADLVRMHDYFQKHFDEISIVGYVRPPATYMTSNFQQRVRHGQALSADPEQGYRNYERTFRKLDNAFGREIVQLWKFDPGSFTQGCVVRDFCSRLGIALPAERIVRRNESLPRQALCLLYTYRRLGEKYGSHTLTARGRHELASLLASVGNDKFRFSPDIIRPVLEKNSADIEWMEARLGQSLREELNEHQPGDVRDEADLLRPDPESVAKLLSLLGDRAPAGVTGETPEQVVRLVHLLRGTQRTGVGARRGESNADQPAPGQKPFVANPGETHLNVAELIEALHKANGQLLDGVPQDKAEALISGVFQHVKSALAGTGEGVVRYANLGVFRVRKVEKEAKGGEITRTAITFRCAEPILRTVPPAP